MRFRRSTTVSPAAQATSRPPAAPNPYVPAADLVALNAQAQRLGFELLPAGVWAHTIGQLEARIAELSTRPDPRRMIDVTETVRETSHIAGKEFPRLVGEHLALRRDHSALRSQAARCEQEVERLATVIIQDNIEGLSDADWEDS